MQHVAALALLASSLGIAHFRNCPPPPVRQARASKWVSPRKRMPNPITGRVYVAISRTHDKPPIEQTDVTGVPLFGHNVTALAAGRVATIDAQDFGAPLASLRDLPAGDYWMQPFVNVYTEFKRSDGHTVWLHMGPVGRPGLEAFAGNLYGAAVKVHFDPASPTPIRPDGRQGDRTHPGAARHAVREALPHQERAAQQVVGTAHLAGRDGAVAARLRQASAGVLPPSSTATATSTPAHR